MSDQLERGQIGSYFGQYIPLAEKFYNSTCLHPRVGLYFHDPVGYPDGKLGGWKTVCQVPLEGAWWWIKAVAAGVALRKYDVAWSVPMPHEPTYSEITDQDVLKAWVPRMAIVVEVTEEQVLALYRDPNCASDDLCTLIRMRP